MEKIKYHFKNLFPIIYLLFIFLTGIIAMIIGGIIIMLDSEEKEYINKERKL